MPVYSVRRYFAIVLVACCVITIFEIVLWSQNQYCVRLDSHRFQLREMGHVRFTNVSSQTDPHFKSWSRGIVTEITPSLKANCSGLFNADNEETTRVTQLLKGSNTFYINANFANCDKIRHEFFGNFYTSETEKSFPIAFILVVYTSVEQILRFLKVIYRPHNLYCIHPDPSSGEEFTNVFKLISRCLPNVFLPSQLQDVKYRTASTIFAAQMNCLKELETHPLVKWQYVVNLCGRELPLQTNRFIVEQLREMEGISIVRIYYTKKHFFKTWFSHREDIKHLKNDEHILIPLGLKLHKNLAYNALSRSFVHHIFHNGTMQQLSQWLTKNCKKPEEFFYATAFMTPGTPGGYYWSQSMAVRDRSINFKVFNASWKYDSSAYDYNPEDPGVCLGRVVHYICIVNSAELPRISLALKQDVWFYNKYYMEEDHVIMDCVEGEVVRANMQEYALDNEIH